MQIASFVASIVVVASIYAVLTLGLNLHFGLGGLINFGIVAYFAVGAYGYAIATQPPPGTLDLYKFGLHWPAWAGIALGLAASLLFALVTGWPTLRLRGEYLALITFAFAGVLGSVLVNAPEIGNGSRGLSSIFPPFYNSIPIRGYDVYFAAGVLVVLAVFLFLLLRLSRSPFGMSLRAVRDDELAAAALGKPVQAFRLKAFLAGAIVAGLAGVLYAWYITFVQPALFTASITFIAFIALVLGGVGSNVGAVVGAFLIFGLDQLLQLLPLSVQTAQLVSSLKLVPYGLVLIIVLRFRPKGLIGVRWP